MRKILFAIPFLFINAFALNDVAVPYTFVDSALIVASEFNKNFDTLELYYNILIDTLNNRFIRTYYLESGDTTLSLAKIQTIKSLDTLRGNPYVDSIKGNPLIHKGLFITDSARVGNSLRLNNMNVGDNPLLDWWNAAGIYAVDIGLGAVAGSSTATYLIKNWYWDSNGNKKNKSNDAVSYLVLETTGNLEYWARSSPGTAGTTFTATKRFFVDSSGNVTTSGCMNADSIKSTKGIVGTKINTGLGNFEVGQDLQTTSDVTFDSLYLTGFLSFGTEPLKVYSDSIMMADSVTWLGKKWYKSDTLNMHYRKIVSASVSVSRGCQSSCTYGYNNQIFHGSQTNIQTDIDGAYAGWEDYILLADSIGAQKSILRVRGSTGVNSFASPLRIFALYKP